VKRLILSLGLLLACDESKSAAPLPSRVEAVSARRVDDSAASLCDPTWLAHAGTPGQDALKFSLPKLTGGAVPDTRAPRWVNLWATWCAPCIEELPRIKKLAAELQAAGSSVLPLLVSVDTTAAAVDEFAKLHPEALGSPRLADPMALETWLGTLGLDKGATLPVHVFVDAEDRIMCVRTGAIRDSDLPALKKLFAPGK
jgi:thiol-disulfide isomerase/thioredoxin